MPVERLIVGRLDNAQKSGSTHLAVWTAGQQLVSLLSDQCGLPQQSVLAAVVVGGS